MYFLTKSQKMVEDLQATVYGIACDGMCIDDVSTDRDFVVDLVEQCNANELNPRYLFGFVEDMIGR